MASEKLTADARSLASIYRHYHDSRESHSFVPPALRFAVDLDKEWRAQSRNADLGDFLQPLYTQVLKDRHDRMESYFKPKEEALKKFINRLAQESGSFDVFKQKAEKLYYGFVLTAHPTFTLTLQEAEFFETQQFKTIHPNNTPPTLEQEVQFSFAAIHSLQEALSDAYKMVFEAALEHYPDADINTLSPKLFTVASWVGFDLDGRSDIGWTDTLSKRMEIQAWQLKKYAAAFDKIAMPDAHDACKSSADSYEEFARFFDIYQSANDAKGVKLQNMSRAIAETREDRLTTIQPLMQQLDGEIVKCIEKDRLIELLALRAQLATLGLAGAHVHFRLNATPVHNAVRKQVDLVSNPEDKRYRQGYMDSIQGLVEAVQPVQIHLGDIRTEETSCKRLFMLMQFILRHIDLDAPIRFLIAETESAFTIMVALYFARMFDVTDKVDICPLIETSEALERSSRMIQQVLDIGPHYLNALKKRGRLCIQTGYSDAGRYIGQLPACGSIERLKERMIHLFKEDARLSGLDMLFFDTHGESWGRGNHPDGISGRLSYVVSPFVLQAFQKTGAHYIQEDSWQGGDGYLPLLNKERCQHIMSAALSYLMEDHEASQDDPYYDELRQSVTEFLTIITKFQQDLMNNPDYGALLSAFGPPLIPAMGSRPLKRQGTDSAKIVELPAAESFRAIPHNAILMQLGYYANVLGGVGRAIQRDPASFKKMSASSERFSSLVSLLTSASSLSSKNDLKAYLSLYDPSFWLDLSEAEKGDNAIDVSGILEEIGFHPAFKKMRDTLNRDAIARLKEVTPQEDKRREILFILHGVRLALIMKIMRLAVRLPEFSPQHTQKRDTLITNLFRLQVPDVLKELHDIFPAGRSYADDCDYGEISTYQGAERDTYAFEWKEIFLPLEMAYKDCRIISHIIAHLYGFSG